VGINKEVPPYSPIEDYAFSKCCRLSKRIPLILSSSSSSFFLFFLFFFFEKKRDKFHNLFFLSAIVRYKCLRWEDPGRTFIIIEPKFRYQLHASFSLIT